MSELRRVFGPFCSEEEIQNMMKEADANGDGEISFEEFLKFMGAYSGPECKIKKMWTVTY